VIEDSRSELTGTRRLSQAIAEGDGISIIARAQDADGARVAEEQGAEGLVLVEPVEAVREGTSLPLLWDGSGTPERAARAGADAWRLVVARVGDAEGQLEQVHAEAIALGLECVVDVCDEEEIELALERLDPEILLLSGRSAGNEQEPLDRVLELLPDVPAGKLAIADVPVRDRADIAALERAGIDGVIVSGVDVAELVGGAPPEV
jgi:indole-3-glycerol phosphate synthase